MQNFEEFITFIANYDKQNIYILLCLILGYFISSLLNKEKKQTEEEINRNYRKSLKYFKKHQAENEAFFNGIIEEQ